MKQNIFKICTFIVLLLWSATPLNAQELDSSSFQIQDFSINFSEQNRSNSASFSLQLEVDEFLQNPRLASPLYDFSLGTPNTWQANVPIIICFETTSDGSSSCADSDVTNGMVQICGEGGCFDKARFEIDPQDNPTDALYSARITTDPTWTTWNYIDGSTFLIETIATHDINDYLLESEWENTASSFNVLGLEQNTTYYLAITALNGDFTESDPSPSINTTTSVPFLSFDIDIDTSAGITSETTSPYTISFESLLFPTVSTANNVIWVDIGTNLPEGALVYGSSANGGLFSPSNLYTLNYVNADLITTPGIGFQVDSINQEFLGPLVAETQFNLSGETVGELSSSTSITPIFNTNGSPIYGGRSSLAIKARPDQNTPSGDDYIDIIVLTIGADL